MAWLRKPLSKKDVQNQYLMLYMEFSCVNDQQICAKSLLVEKRTAGAKRIWSRRKTRQGKKLRRGSVSASLRTLRAH
jgi:hypothetical protein